MTPLGKPLVFYLKHMAEMNRLYQDLEEGEERDLKGLDDPEHVMKMTRTVGDAACEHVADFLQACGKEIEDHFARLGIATLAKKAKRAWVAANWDWSAKYQVASVPGGWFYCGVWITAPPEVRISLEKDSCGVVVPWLWSKGGRKGADAVWKILGGWPHSRSGEGVVKERGSIARLHPHNAPAGLQPGCGLRSACRRDGKDRRTNRGGPNQGHREVRGGTQANRRRLKSRCVGEWAARP